jgi:transcriptional regulator with XRE-family HTH domain
MRFDPEALSLAVDARRVERGISDRRVAAEACTSPSALTRLAQGRTVSIDVLVALLGWLGETDLKPYLAEDP